MGPVLLLDMGIIVLVIGTAAGEIDGLFPLGKEFQEVIIEELPAVITIEAEDRKRERNFNVLNLFEGVGFPLAPDGPLFGPTGADIGGIHGIDKHA